MTSAGREQSLWHLCEVLPRYWGNTDSYSRIARQAGLILKKPRISMKSITGPMDIVGEANVVLKFDGLKHTTFALIARGMDFTCLIAWHDLQPLDIISHTFSARISASASHDLTSSIVNDFPSVFVEKLCRSPMNVLEMKIDLTDPYVPYHVSTARQVPLRCQTMAEQIVNARVVEPESDPKEWWAPAFFVPKGDGLRVRLVSDYMKLNRYVRRPVHPFPLVKEIVQALPARTKYFAKMDALHGYFQLVMDEQSSKITKFLLPSGRYRYLQAPMGLSSTSDKWCRHSDRVIEGMPFAKKIVDDILVWATELPTLYDRVRSIAKRCADLNIALSKKKFAVSTELSFAGLIFSAEGIKPDPERIVSLSNFPVPKDVTGVRLFLGQANQLSGFVPDFAHMTVKLWELTAKKNAFFWLEEHQLEFEKVKELLT